MLKSQASKKIYSISELNSEIKKLLEGEFAQVLAEGEISNLTQPRSGHLYFTLKDENAQVRCAMFKGSQSGLGFKPKDGLQVVARCRVSLYAPRGDYQLIVQHLEVSGEGALRRAFEVLKNQLAMEGLFEQQLKQPIPQFPSTIGVITSPTGAAVQDIIHVLNRRFPATKVIIYPTRVQGNEAALEIVEAIQLANEDVRVDMLIVGRGGGSLEDLWCFNEESVARAIFHSELPIISAIGHETDFSIADFVADVRAPTPSAAAELATPDHTEVFNLFYSFEKALTANIQQTLDNQKQRLNWLNKRLKHPSQKLEESAQRLDQLEAKLLFAWKQKLKWCNQTFLQLHTQFNKINLHKILMEKDANLNERVFELETLMKNKLKDARLALQQAAHHLNTLSPLNTLQRGYSITLILNHQKQNHEQTQEKRVVQSMNELNQGDRLVTQLKDGQCTSIIETLYPVSPEKELN